MNRVSKGAPFGRDAQRAERHATFIRLVMPHERDLVRCARRQAFSMLIGTVEIALALLILARAFAPKVSALGSLGAAVTFLVTLSFLLTTPAMAVWQPGYGFPALSPDVGQFLIKDIVLLGAAVWSAGEALLASRVGVPQAQINRTPALASAKPLL